MNNSPINSTINSTTVVELADASSLKGPKGVNRCFAIKKRVPAKIITKLIGFIYG